MTTKTPQNLIEKLQLEATGRLAKNCVQYGGNEYTETMLKTGSVTMEVDEIVEHTVKSTLQAVREGVPGEADISEFKYDPFNPACLVGNSHNTCRHAILNHLDELEK